MGLKDYIAMVAAGGSLVFGWVASQDQLCDMRLAKPICIDPPAASSTPTPASATAPAPQTTDAPPAVAQPSVQQQTPAAAQSAPPPLAVGQDLSGGGSASVPQAALTSEQAAQFEERVRGYLNDSAKNNAADFHASAGDSIVAMQPATTHSVQLPLNRGVRYRVLGACDDDCTAIALEAYDPNGALVTRSDGSGDFPVLELTPNSGGQYSVRVRLLRCAVAPCFVGVRVLEQ